MTTAVQQYLPGHKSGSQRLLLIRWKCFFLLKLTVTNVRGRGEINSAGRTRKRSFMPKREPHFFKHAAKNRQRGKKDCWLKSKTNYWIYYVLCYLMIFCLENVHCFFSPKERRIILEMYASSCQGLVDHSNSSRVFSTGTGKLANMLTVVYWSGVWLAEASTLPDCL